MAVRDSRTQKIMCVVVRRHRSIILIVVAVSRAETEIPRETIAIGRAS